ncbi:hypothetical protein [Azorhizobium caulinodans]|uniref:hypothetical protein n=1 Tax=Azorhizobium caulinodans TaxID=7 RepID=UPI002FBEF69B
MGTQRHGAEKPLPQQDVRRQTGDDGSPCGGAGAHAFCCLSDDRRVIAPAGQSGHVAESAATMGAHIRSMPA